MIKGIKFFKNNEGFYFAEKVFKSGMTGRIEIGDFTNNSNKKIYWSVFLVVYHKRKQINTLTLKQTGKDGLEPLIWAKQAILSFESILIKSDFHENLPTYIYVGADDKRRFRAYQKGLSRHGFRKACIEGEWVLIKEIKFA